jgi:hypothetical protein
MAPSQLYIFISHQQEANKTLAVDNENINNANKGLQEKIKVTEEERLRMEAELRDRYALSLVFKGRDSIYNIYFHVNSQWRAIKGDGRKSISIVRKVEAGRAWKDKSH